MLINKMHYCIEYGQKLKKHFDNIPFKNLNS